MPFGIDPALFDGAVSAAFGLIFTVAELREFSRSMEAEEWPTVDGTVEEVGVTSDWSTAARTVTYAPAVRYHYEVGGRKYVGDRIAFGGTASVSYRGWAARIAGRYAGRGHVKVYVCPDDPMTAVLEPGIHFSCWLVLGVAILFLGIGITGLLTHWGLVDSSIQFK